MTRKHISHLLLSFIFIALLTACGGTKQVVQVETPPAPQPSPKQETVQPRVESVKKESSPYMWKGIDYEGEPWVKNCSRPFTVTNGLQNRHVTVWASHGRYYDIGKETWKWQRPFLFGTTEDLFTQTIVVPYLIPMLENAGAIVFSPRERDWQKNEVIVDNDDDNPLQYKEINRSNKWMPSPVSGFANRDSAWHDRENPFESGSARMANAVKAYGSEIVYQPDLPEAGNYAVYVSYPSNDKNVDDAEYKVIHQGQETLFHVNQKMGGGTWVYLGNFDFDKGCNSYNQVILSSVSTNKGVVSADAVRFGGGMGNIERGGSVSGMPRCLEGARYYAQWAGTPYHVYSSKEGQDDYSDDINVRSFMTNWLAGGSCFVPDTVGKKVPIELSVAVHSDAGFSNDFTSIYGSLGVCTTNHNNGLLQAGISREASRSLMNTILDGAYHDLSRVYGKWAIRERKDANYSETRCPMVPSTIFETLSHQNFPDMVLAQDPNFRFTLARSIYKSILKHVANSHGKSFTVAPLPPQSLRIEFTSADEVKLKWENQKDTIEKSAQPNSYVVYKSVGTGGFDNGTVVKGTSCELKLTPGLVYSFKVTAINKGGESFPSETVSAIHHTGATKSVLIINGFNRLSAPAAFNTADEQGFNFDADPGVPYIRTAGYSGKQICFDKKMVGIEGPGGLGYSGQEWQGKILAGNTFEHIRTHAYAMQDLKQYNVASCSAKAVEDGKVNIMKYHVVDFLLGMQKLDQNKVIRYKTFTESMQQKMREYARSGGSIMVSGAYVGSDMRSRRDSLFVSDVLKLRLTDITRADSDSIVTGMGTKFSFHRVANEKHYPAISTDIIHPIAPAFCALTLENAQPVCVAYGGNDYKTFTMSIPFECITNENQRRTIMKGILQFLTDN
ncbi:MAG: fibronectin type III domain-containing protein [Prevotella sp.]|nr:fibronectin type III domain-containing protein [Prevotella sp.]